MLTVFTDTGEAKNRLAKCDVNFKVPKAKWYVLFRIHTQWAPSNGSQRTHTHTHTPDRKSTPIAIEKREKKISATNEDDDSNERKMVVLSLR